MRMKTRSIAAIVRPPVVSPDDESDWLQSFSIIPDSEDADADESDSVNLGVEQDYARRFDGTNWQRQPLAETSGGF